MNQERVRSHYYESTIPHLQEEDTQQALATLPLPAPAVVIDVCPQTTYDYPLLWNLATEIEDLAAQMRLKYVPHWEYLEECIDFLHVTSEEMPRAGRYITVTSRSDKQAFTSDAEFAAHLYTSYINRVRSNRQSAAVRLDERGRSSFSSAVGPVQSTVRIFLLVDMNSQETFLQAIQYATAVKQYSRDYDEPERTGHDERISVSAVCMNADPKQREALFQLYPLFETAFDTVILIQAYRDDETFIGHDIQAYEVEQILYALLLASPGEISEGQNDIDDENPGRYLAFVEQPAIAPACTIYMIGVSSTEYSARWGKRWLSYGLVVRLIELIEDKQEIEYEDTLLQLPGGAQWYDIWWAQVQNTLLNALPILLPPTGPAMAGLFSPARVQQTISLTATLSHLETLHGQMEAWYSEATRQTLQTALESIIHLPAVVKSKMRDQNKAGWEELTPENEALRNTVTLQEQARQVLVLLFRDAKGALPRALLQLDRLNNKFQVLDRQSRHVPDLRLYQEQFENDLQKAHREMERSFRTWHIPFLGPVLRLSVVLCLVALCLVLVLTPGIAPLLLPPWQQFTRPLLTSLAGPSMLLVSNITLRLLLLLFVFLITFMLFRRLSRQLRTQQRAGMNRLYERLRDQQGELQTLLITRAALQLLTEAGLYDARSETSKYLKHLRGLEAALKETQLQAAKGQERAFARLRLSLSPTQIGLPQQMTWLSLNTRRDWLPWPRITDTFQQLSHRFEEGDLFFDELVRHMLHQAAPELPVVAPGIENQQLFRSAALDERKELQLLASELVAAMISARTSRFNLMQVEPQIQRYLTLQARSLQEPSLFTESITSLEQAVKALQLEQTIRGADALSAYEIYDSFFLRRDRTLEHMLATWVSHYCQLETEAQEILNQQTISARLQEAHINPDDAIADLQARYQLFGYHNFTREGSHDHIYLLLIPGMASEDFFHALDRIQLPHFQWVRFPDEEKLIYMHVHRTRFHRHNLPKPN